MVPKIVKFVLEEGVSYDKTYLHRGLYLMCGSLLQTTTPYKVAINDNGGGRVAIMEMDV